MDNHKLCSYCAAIDFEYLQNPTVDSILRLNKGAEIYGEYPFKFDTSDLVGPRWRLGTQQRIDESAATCPLCRAIVAVLDDSNLRSQKSALFAENPICQADIYWSAALKPPSETQWKLPASVSQGRFDRGSFSFYLRRMSLRWHSFESGESLEPGSIETTLDVVPRSWTVLNECFQTLDPEHHAATADLFHDERILSSQQLFGGRKRPALIDLELPKCWLKECLANHGQNCSRKDGVRKPKIISVFRLIDIEDKSLVEFQNADLENFRYATLSYIWGITPQRLQLKHGNLRALTSAGALNGTVSKTIEDAITFSSRMRLPYLWVDALCILQDDDDDKSTQIGSMGDIYKCALFTIVAGSGHDAEAGLPGLNLPRTAEQHEVLVKPATHGRPPIRLLSTLTPRRSHWAHYAEDLHWSSRGWTLQEKVLSRRVLTFTDQQLFWACRKCQWWEEAFLETNLAKTNWFSVQEREFVLDPSVAHSCVPEDPQAQVWYQLARLVRDYGERRLTIQGDAHDAFSAVLNECTSFVQEPFLWGLPASARFEIGLCWEPYREGLARREGLTTLPATTLKRKVPFPSWSWIGWEGAVVIRFEDKYIDEGIEPQVLCYILRNSPLRLVKVSRVAADNPRHVQVNFMIQNTKPTTPLAITLDAIYSNCPGLTPDRMSDTPDDELLFFWTEISRFTLSGPVKRTLRTSQRDHEIGQFEVLDAEGNVVGLTGACRTTVVEARGVKKDVEFVVIANNRPIQYPPQKIVLQVEQRDGVAYRVNIAEIREESWNSSIPNRVLIALG